MDIIVSLALCAVSVVIPVVVCLVIKKTPYVSSMYP